MPRLRNEATGVVVDVSDETASLLGTDYKPVTEKQAATKTPAKKATASSKTEK